MCELTVQEMFSSWTKRELLSLRATEHAHRLDGV